MAIHRHNNQSTLDAVPDHSSATTGQVIAKQSGGGLAWEDQSGGGGSGDAAKETITQSSHGFAAGDVLRHNGTIYTKAQADSSANAEAVGIVESVDGNDFTIVYAGRITITGASWTAGSVYYLSASSLGALTTTEAGDSQVSKPMLVATSTTSGIVINYRGLISSGGSGSSSDSVNILKVWLFS